MALGVDSIWAMGAPKAHQWPTFFAGSHPLPGSRQGCARQAWPGLGPTEEVGGIVMT